MWILTSRCWNGTHLVSLSAPLSFGTFPKRDINSRMQFDCNIETQSYIYSAQLWITLSTCRPHVSSHQACRCCNISWAGHRHVELSHGSREVRGRLRRAIKCRTWVACLMGRCVRWHANIKAPRSVAVRQIQTAVSQTMSLSNSRCPS